MIERNNRILIVDDNRSIHDDFHKILTIAPADEKFAAAEAVLFDIAAPVAAGFRLTSALQGEEAVEIVRAALAAGTPFALAFVDVRMPPGIDGIETVRRLWALDPDLQVVICSAYTDYSWTEIVGRLGAAERWVILKKPFDNIEVLQLAHALAEKWLLRRQTKAQLSDLERIVAARTVDLEAALERLRRESTERLRVEEERRGLDRKLEETQRLEGLGVLAGGIAHDFNNILTGILISASLAREDAPPGSELHAHLRRIEENSRRAAGLCEQMLTYAGKGNLRIRTLDLNDLVRETLELLQVSLPKDAELLLDFAGSLPAVKGDPAQLRQVLMNLVTNAAEALRAAPRRIRLVTGYVTLDPVTLKRTTHPAEARAGDFVFVEATDTGSGMSPETMRRIFEPFYTTKFTGRGLGLCAVLGIMRSHAGVLDVSSEEGRGTTFRVYFPTAGVVVPEVIQTAPRVPVRRGAGRVLVVDDEESVRMVAAAALRRHGFDVIATRDGIEAIEVVERGDRDLIGVLVDLTMPGMDGPAALIALRKVLPELPAVLMSGHDQAEARRRFEGLSRVGFLQKPFTVNALVDIVTENFCGGPAAGTERTVATPAFAAADEGK